MLTHLRVKNIALIDDIALDLDEGLNILTGETGAGKSIILGAVNLALGGRVSKELLGDGTMPAQVDLVFDVTGTRAKMNLEEMGILEKESGGEVLLSRRIAPNGRAINRLNGEIVTAAVLQKAASLLIDVHGQHEHQSLLDAKGHIDLLDRFDERAAEHKASLRELLRQYHEKEAESRRWQEQARDKERLMALMEYEAQEIDSAAIQEGEEEELNQLARRKRAGLRIQQSCAAAYEALRGDSYGGGAVDLMNEALSQIRGIEELDPEMLSPLASSLMDAAAIAEDVAREVHSYGEESDSDSEALQQAEERLDQIGKLKSKYGNNLDQIRQYRANLEASIRKIENVNETLGILEEEKNRLRIRMEKEAQALHALREKAAGQISGEITELLNTLQFQDPEFAVTISQKEEIGPKGRDQVQFMIRTNVGEKLRPLDRIASGGEISRIMLAIKTVLAQRDEIPTLIFDEIDSGISGRTAQSVAEKLAMISRYHQIVCITHLPQIAAMADHHMRIEKTAVNGRARTEVCVLSQSGSEEELARMLGGTQMTETARQNACEMKKLAQDWKKHN